MQTRPLLCLAGLLFAAGCLDWSTASSHGDDAGVGPHDGALDDDGGKSACPDKEEACAAQCGTFQMEGCPPYDCGACADDGGVCRPRVSCESIGAECGTVNNGCETETCTDRCDGVRCVDYRCCQPEDVAKTCAGSCGGTVVNNCGEEVLCDPPCGPTSSGCESAAPPVAAVCHCPHADQGPTCEQTQFLLHTPVAIAYDAARQVGYVIDEYRDALLEIDHVTGARRVLSDDDDDGMPRGAGPAFAYPRGLVIDPPRKVAYVSDLSADAIFKVDLANGNRTVLSDADDNGVPRGYGPALENPKGMALDWDKRRLLVVGGQGELHEVDLDSGTRALVSSANFDGMSVGTGPRLDIPQDIALDVPNHRALVFGTDSLLSVELETGNRTLISTSSTSSNDEGVTRGEGPLYTTALTGVLIGDRAFVVDLLLDAMFSVDLTTGDRSIVSGLDGSGNTLGVGPMFESIRGLANDPDGQHVLAISSAQGAAFRIDTATGARSVIYDSGVGTGPDFGSAVSIALRPEQGFAYVTGRKEILRVDLASGLRSVVASDFATLKDAAFDLDGQTAYVVDSGVGLVRIDLATGERVVVSDNANPAHNTITLRADPRVLHDPTRSRVLVVQNHTNKVTAIDLRTGLRTLLAGASRGTQPVLGVPGGFALDSSRNRILLVDKTSLGVLSVDLLTGDRVLVSGKQPDGTLVGAGPLPTSPAGAALDLQAGVLYVTDPTIGLFRIDLASGDRTTISLASSAPGTSLGKGLGLNASGALALDRAAGYVYVGGSVIGRYELQTGDRRIISKFGF